MPKAFAKATGRAEKGLKGVNSLLLTNKFRNVINFHGKTSKDTIFRKIPDKLE
jgi:hypothetical protein